MQHYALYNKLAQGVRWSWTDTDARAFQQIKERAANYFQLYLLDPTSSDELTIRLRSDASDWGVGLALFQGKRLVAIYRYAFNTTEQRWSTINQEA